jgi:hypothetical protein
MFWNTTFHDGYLGYGNDRIYIRNEIVNAFKHTKRVIGHVSSSILPSLIFNILYDNNLIWITENDSLILDELIKFVEILQLNRDATREYPLTTHTTIEYCQPSYIICTHFSSFLVDILFNTTNVHIYRTQQEEELYCIYTRINRIEKGINTFVFNCVYALKDIDITDNLREEIRVAVKIIIFESQLTFRYIKTYKLDDNFKIYDLDNAVLCIIDAINSSCFDQNILIFYAIEYIINCLFTN